MDKGTRTKEQGQRNKDKGTRTKEQGQRNKDKGQYNKKKMKTLFKTSCIILTSICMVLTSCEPVPIEPTPTQTGDSIASLRGMFILNEGTFNQNNASLDYLDFTTGIYTQDTFCLANPNIQKGLGDVANDIVVYGNKAYIAVNGSGIVEVADAHTARHITTINVPNCRRLFAYQDKVYVTSYAGRLEDENHQLGYVACIDTASLTITAQGETGYQPEGIAALGGKIYVANSGGYVGMNLGTYDNRITILNAALTTKIGEIETAPNPQDIIADPAQNALWVSSFGNYYDVSANLYRINPQDTTSRSQMDIPVSKMVLVGDTLYLMASTYDENWNQITHFYTLDTKSRVQSEITLDATLTTPYALAVNPVTKDLYISDAGDYVNPGTLYCFSHDGKEKWHLRTGVLPGHFAFVK